ncbi:hypothetical protein [Planococcus koreensis]|uniref:hypothetical protein n=1 Tax=Planococcus koreensis TaxID=112331 RepID=UPI0039FCB77F
MAKVLAVLSGGYADEENNYVTGWWAEELFAPVLALEKKGIQSALLLQKAESPLLTR